MKIQTGTQTPTQAATDAAFAKGRRLRSEAYRAAFVAARRNILSLFSAFATNSKSVAAS